MMKKHCVYGLSHEATPKEH